MSVAETFFGGGTARRAAGVAVVGFAGHLVFARLATLWEFADDPVIALWPAVGIVIGIAMVVRTQWWFVLIGAWIAKVLDLLVWSSDLPTRTIIALLAAQMIEQLIATMLALSLIEPPEILRPATRTVPMVVGSTALAAAVGAATLVAIGDFADASLSFRAWFIGDGVGIVIGAPTVYGLALVRRLPSSVEARLELVATVAATLAVTVWAFEVTTPVAVLTLPLLGWLAVRFGMAASSPVAFVVAMWSTWRTSQGSGPFSDPDDPVLDVQLFTAAVAVTALIVGAEAIELDRRRRRLEGLLASVPDLVMVVDGRGRIIEDFTSEAGAGDLVGHHVTDAVMDGFADEIEDAQIAWLTTGRASMTVEHLSRSKNRPNTYETRFKRIAPDQAIAVSRDITHRAGERIEAQRQSRRWRDLMNGSFQGLAEIDRDGVFIEANERLASIVGRPAMSLLGLNVDDVVGAEHWPGWDEDLKRMRSGERVSAEVSVDGRTAAIVVMPRVDRDGTFSGALVLALDTTGVPGEN